MLLRYPKASKKGMISNNPNNTPLMMSIVIPTLRILKEILIIIPQV